MPTTAKRPAVRTASLWLLISGTAYCVHWLDPHPDVARQALRLQKTNGEFYDVVVDEHGISCTCPDFSWRVDGKTDRTCKHCWACQDRGLLGG